MCFITLAFVFITGCGKDKTPAAKTNTELISQSTWKFSAATVGGSDVSGFIQTCQKDNILVFAAAGTGTLDEGATKCNAGDPQTRPFTWNFMTNETVLHVSTVLFTGGSSDFTLVTLNETQLVVSQNVTISGTSQNAVVTFIH
jgi:lipocalin-like protein